MAVGGGTARAGRARAALIGGLVLLVGVALLPAVARAAISSSEPTYDNPVFEGDFPDPSVIRVGSTYYAYGTNRVGNVPVLKSTDLAHWTRVGDALPTLPGWAVKGDTWAPSVLQLSDDSFVLYYTVHDSRTGLQCLSRATSDQPEGPFSDPSGGTFMCQVDRRGSIDPSPFVDRDGTPWLVWKSEGRTDGEPTRFWTQRLTADGIHLTGPVTELLHTSQPWQEPIIENPTMVMLDGNYYLFYSANRWETPDYAIGYARCASVTGPCWEGGNGPILPKRDRVLGPGGPSFFTDTRGATWLAYHAWTSPDVGYPDGKRTLRIDKVAMVDGAPVIDGPTDGTESLVRASRLAGPDRYATAAALSASRFLPGVDVAYVATGSQFADALAAGPAAADDNAPTLLVSANGVPAVTEAELRRLKPSRIVVLGGQNVVPDLVLLRLARFTSGPTVRVAGTDRYDTSAKVSAASFQPGVPVAYVATGQQFADALAAGAAGAAQHGPVLLVERDRVPTATASELQRLRPGKIVLVGGETAVGSGVERQLGQWTTGSVVRAAGADRYATSAEVARLAFPAPVGEVTITTGRGFADAVAAGGQAQPVLLVGGSVSAPVQDQVTRLARDGITVLGGPGAVPDSALAQLDLRG